FDHRQLFHAEGSVVVEISLLHAAVFDGDLAAQRSRQAEYHGAVDLLLQNVGVDYLAAVYRRDDALDLGLVAIHGDLDHLGSIRAETAERRDSAITAGGQWLFPAGLFRSHF